MTTERKVDVTLHVRDEGTHVSARLSAPFPIPDAEDPIVRARIPRGASDALRARIHEAVRHLAVTCLMAEPAEHETKAGDAVKTCAECKQAKPLVVCADCYVRLRVASPSGEIAP